MSDIDAIEEQASHLLHRRVRSTLDQLRGELLAARNESGHWLGQLAPSALSTATAVSAIAATVIDTPGRDERDGKTWHDLIRRGTAYLRSQQNDDGGFGDTDRSYSNIATSYLVLAASALAARAGGAGLEPRQLERLRDYVARAGALDALRARYGTDKTFVVPILTNLAIAGEVGWEIVPALPFEAAVFPQSMYRLLQMPVVSYAIPALVAIGQARHFHGPRAWFPLRQIRAMSIARSLDVLERMQPESGGYLEATPLTSFVVMSLAVTGRGSCRVADRGLNFLRASMSDDGSWPIDTNLATWLTSLAVTALASDPADDGVWCQDELVDWQLACQHQRRHPFTGAEPGGWGWSDLSGAVPDSDDTPAAMLALTKQRRWVSAARRPAIDRAIDRGADWLLRLQNRNGGWPTFCRGWGKLPFDRSSTDLTAHAIRALSAPGNAHESAAGNRRAQIDRAIQRGLGFLADEQAGDGSWRPLWFGNQDEPDESNPVYGTSRVLLVDAEQLGGARAGRGLEFLLGRQNRDGGWGGGPSLNNWLASHGPNRQHQSPMPVNLERSGQRGEDAGLVSSIEETALAVEALVENLGMIQNQGASTGVKETTGGRGGNPVTSPSRRESENPGETDRCKAAIIRGVEFLLQAVAERRHDVPWPIGFYFAKLWYHEQLYPLIFSVSAMGNFLRRAAPHPTSDADELTHLSSAHPLD